MRSVYEECMYFDTESRHTDQVKLCDGNSYWVPQKVEKWKYRWKVEVTYQKQQTSERDCW